MNNKLKDKIVKLSYELIHIPNSNFKHFTYIVDGNKILSIGYNNAWKTHTIAHKYKYLFNCIHSEVSAIIRFQYHEEYLPRCKVVNVRINKAGNICMAKPCNRCLSILTDVGFKEIWFTNNSQSFERL